MKTAKSSGEYSNEQFLEKRSIWEIRNEDVMTLSKVLYAITLMFFILYLCTSVIFTILRQYFPMDNIINNLISNYIFGVLLSLGICGIIGAFGSLGISINRKVGLPISRNHSIFSYGSFVICWSLLIYVLIVRIYQLYYGTLLHPEGIIMLVFPAIMQLIIFLFVRSYPFKER